MIMSKRSGIAFLAVVGVIAAIFLLILIVLIIGWVGDNNRNADRLRALEADGILRCQVPGIVPLPSKDVNTTGTSQGIGYGGTSPTLVTRDFYLGSASPASVTVELMNCAKASGWIVTMLPGSLADSTTSFRGTKVFSGGWMAALNMGVMMHAPFANQPIVELSMETDGV